MQSKNHWERVCATKAVTEVSWYGASRAGKDGFTDESGHWDVLA